MLLDFGDRVPEVQDPVFIAPGAYVIGQVSLGRFVSVWFNAVLRADTDAIRVGEGSNIQDGCVIHVDPGTPVTIGRNVTVGHRAIIHGATVGDRVLVGMGAILMSGVKVGERCIVAAGALVTEGTEIPPGSVVMGAPARVVRGVTEAEVAAIERAAERYQRLWQDAGWQFR
ncbi:MAG: gamma carbonic anhydrase family protein [Firmicutes bacterium]|nr:gamma carbonic anhydrase family protein [Alicyclobacillaceae bacterium]MCL6497451.1 gamma carbonic anhydrase family protein [Bacillota bacterium]